MAHAEGRTCEEVDMQMDDADEELTRLRSSLRAAEAERDRCAAEVTTVRDRLSDRLRAAEAARDAALEAARIRGEYEGAEGLVREAFALGLHAARAESEGTRLDGTFYKRCPLCHAPRALGECVFGDPIPPDDLPPRESIHDAASRDGQGETPPKPNTEMEDCSSRDCDNWPMFHFRTSRCPPRGPDEGTGGGR